jgi:predicted NACHT family NTPase
MNNLTTMTFENDDTNKTKIKQIWGNILTKLTPKQRQFVVEIISNLNVPSSASHLSFEMSALVQEVRLNGHASIQQRCGMTRVLNMSQPLKLNDIYTNVNVLDQISGRRRLEVAELLKISVSDEFERTQLRRIATDRMNGLEAVKKYDKLIVLGKPGSGKTTFLKYVALQCSSGELQANRVPIFITLKDFAETQQQPSLLGAT